MLGAGRRAFNSAFLVSAAKFCQRGATPDPCPAARSSLAAPRVGVGFLALIGAIDPVMSVVRKFIVVLALDQEMETSYSASS
jgi:hypothetical protein